MPRRVDSEYLRHVAYANPVGLLARTSMYEYQRPKIDLVGAVLDAAGDLDGRRLVDVGCGPGRYLTAARRRGAQAVGLDLSAGMLQSLGSHGGPAAVADATALPLACQTADVVLACHMLYHLADPRAALDEFRRVLVAGGRFVATVIGPGHLQEIDEMWMPLVAAAGLDTGEPDLGLRNRQLPGDVLEELLQSRFVAVQRRDLMSAVVVNDPAPVLNHATTTTGVRTAAQAVPRLPRQLHDRLAERIERDGEFRLTTSVSLFSADAA